MTTSSGQLDRDECRRYRGGPQHTAGRVVTGQHGVGGTTSGAGNVISGNNQDASSCPTASPASPPGQPHRGQHRGPQRRRDGRDAEPAGDQRPPQRRPDARRRNRARRGQHDRREPVRRDSRVQRRAGHGDRGQPDRHGSERHVAMANGRHGINLGPRNVRTTVGGTTPAAANVIAFNAGTGVLLERKRRGPRQQHPRQRRPRDRSRAARRHAGSAGLTFPTLTAVTTSTARRPSPARSRLRPARRTASSSSTTRPATRRATARARRS